jgi:branched-chain amino acid transport system permease protein
MELLTTAVVAGVLSGVMYALVGAGHSLLFRSTGLINLGHGELVIIGALVGYTLTQSMGVPLILGATCAVVAAAAVSLAVKLLVIDQMPSATVLPIAVCTFGLALVTNAALGRFWGTDIYSLPPFPGSPGTIHVLYDRATLPGQAVWILGAAVLVFGGLFLLEQKTELGRMLRAVGADPDMARTFGIPARRVAWAAFLLVGATAGLAGLVLAPVLFMTVAGAVTLGLKGLVAAILGGFAHRSGALVGGLFLGLSEQFVVAYFGAGWQDTVVFAVLLVVLLARPEGILASAERSAVR